MSIRKNIISAVALSGSLSAVQAGASLACEIKVISFESGQKHAIGCFLSDANTCKLQRRLRAGHPDDLSLLSWPYSLAWNSGSFSARR